MEAIELKVAGVTFEGRQEILKGMMGAPRLARLVREPDNKYDPNAIAVVANGQKIGYIPKAIAGDLAGLLPAIRFAWLHPAYAEDLGNYYATLKIHFKEA
ncbi:MAG: HIRAN domain-containing protein [Victivallales bacterium]|nr:HIRAN domain-containing protein [Victivallales bacterium]